MASLSHMNMEVVSTNGVVLSLPQKAGMQSSLPLLQKNYKFSKVLFWGRLYGLTGDYLVAVGLEDSYTAKTFFYWCAPASSAALRDRRGAFFSRMKFFLAAAVASVHTAAVSTSLLARSRGARFFVVLSHSLSALAH